MNPIQAAKIHWLETGTFDPALMLEAKHYVEANPLSVDRQYLKILNEIKEGNPRMGDGETLILLKQRKTELEQKDTRPRFIPATAPKPIEPPDVEPDYIEIDL